MSTDVYLFAEVWDAGQKQWRLALPPRRHVETCFGLVTSQWWEPQPSYADTNRALLTVLVDDPSPFNPVRGVAPARGLPSDLSPELAAHAVRKDFAHSHSYLLVSEWIAFPWWQPALPLYAEVPPADAPFFGNGKRCLTNEQIRAQIPNFPGCREFPLEGPSPGQVPVQWFCSYACFARADFMKECLPLLTAFGPPEHVRAVFWAG